MLQSLILRKSIPDDDLKSYKKSIESNDKLSQLKYSLLTNDYQAAEEIIKKFKAIHKCREFDLLYVFYLIEIHDYSRADSLINSIQAEEADILRLLLLKSQSMFQNCLDLLQNISIEGKVFEQVFCLCKLGLSDKAISLIEDIEISNNDHISNLCLLYLKENYSAILELIPILNQPTDIDMLLLKASCEIKLQMYSQALDTLDELVTINNKFKSAWVLLGIAYYKLSVFSDSFYSFVKALSFNPFSFEDWFNISLVLRQTRPELTQILNQKLNNLKDYREITQLEFLFPVIDFSEFGKRKSEFVPNMQIHKNQVLVKPIAKKAKKYKNKKKQAKDESDLHLIAQVLGAIKNDKKTGFTSKDAKCSELPTKRKRRN